MEKKNTMEILNEIRDFRNQELSSQGQTDTSVIKVELLGNGEKSKENLYRLIEVKEFKDRPSIELEKIYIYDGEPKLISIYDRQTDKALPVGIRGNENEKWDIYKEDIEKTIQERDRELKEIAKELGLDKDEITALHEIDLEQKIREKLEENDQEKDEKEEEKEKDKNDEDEISKETINKVGLKNEVDVNVLIDEKGRTLKDELGLDGYTKIGVVHAYKLTEMTNEKGEKETRESLKFGLVGQKPDGSYVKIPEEKLRMYRGSNTEITAIKNPQEIETKRSDCIFEVPGKDSKLAIRQEDPYGRPEVYYVKTSRDNDGNMAEKLQDRYKGTEKTDVEVRTLFNENRGLDNAKNMKKEAEQHPEDEEKGVKEVDGDPNTGHIHFDPENEEHQLAVNDIMKEGKVSEETAKAMLIAELEENKYRDITLKEAKDNVIEMINDQFRGRDNKR